MGTPLVELRNVTIRYTGVTAIANLSLQLFAGEVFCLLGENGAGKSTVIKVLTGVEAPSQGEVLVDGAVTRFSSPRDARECGIATVYQEGGTLPLMSVARNFVLAAEPQKGRGLFRRLDLDEALRLLSPSERVCVSLCFGAGMSHAEAADALKAPLGTVKSHARRGLEKLRKRLVPIAVLPVPVGRLAQ